MEGVEGCSVNMATGRLTVEFDPSKTGLGAIKQKIEKKGFGWAKANKAGGGPPNKKEAAPYGAKVIVAAIFSLPLLYVAMGHMLPFGWSLPLPKIVHHSHHPLNFALFQLALAIPAIIAGLRFYTAGYRGIWRLSPNMDSLIAMGTSAALLYSMYATYQIAQGDAAFSEHLNYETAAMIVTLVLLGRFLEASSMGKTNEAIKKLMGLRPATATVIKGGQEMEMPIDDVAAGDMVLVRPGSKIPVDGVVEEGATNVDESMLTGESMTVEKKAGDDVYAASINKNGLIKFRAAKVGEDTALGQIIKLVEDAQGSKAPIAKLADKVAGVFVPIVFSIALAAFIGWLIATRDLSFALTIFISVLVIACPCALGIATPTSIIVGTGVGAENGILIKSGAALETAHKVKTIVFDKTGTITEGRPEIADIAAFNGIDAKRLLQIAASAEKGSEHPLGEAIVMAAEKEGLGLLPLTGFESLTGMGIRCFIEGRGVLIGNLKLMHEQGIAADGIRADGIAADGIEADAGRLADEGKTPVYIAIDKKIAGFIAIADVVKKTSAKAIKRLADMGIEVAMITGDNERTAKAIAGQVGISRAMSQVMPQDKANEVKKMQSQGKKVAMVGDGINDAPALAAADVGIAVGSGTDVAMESADIVLMHSDLAGVPDAIGLSRATIKNIKQNLFWAFGYNVVGIPVAAGVLHIFGGPLLSPIMAAAAMSLSCLSILANALRLKKFKMEPFAKPEKLTMDN
jgi:Cu+-exporting ATPase